jgi:hypothetical protein
MPEKIFKTLDSSKIFKTVDYIDFTATSNLLSDDRK